MYRHMCVCFLIFHTYIYICICVYIFSGTITLEIDEGYVPTVDDDTYVAVPLSTESSNDDDVATTTAVAVIIPIVIIGSIAVCFYMYRAKTLASPPPPSSSTLPMNGNQVYQNPIISSNYNASPVTVVIAQPILHGSTYATQPQAQAQAQAATGMPAGNPQFRAQNM